MNHNSDEKITTSGVLMSGLFEGLALFLIFGHFLVLTIWITSQRLPKISCGKLYSKSMNLKCLVVSHSAYNILFLFFNHTKINIKHLSFEFYKYALVIFAPLWSFQIIFDSNQKCADNWMNSFLNIVSSSWILSTFDLKSERNEIETDQSEG